MADGSVVIHPMPIGGGFGINLEHDAAVQAALLARDLKRPVQVMWSRARGHPAGSRPRARRRQDGGAGRQSGADQRLARQDRRARDRARTGRAAARRRSHRVGGAGGGGGSDGYAMAGATPFYQIPSYAIDHHPADIGMPTGHWRSGAHSYTCFFTECFIDELAHVAKTEAMSFRIGMLGGDARLARCLTTVAALGGWEGGVPGSGQGIACHTLSRQPYRGVRGGAYRRGPVDRRRPHRRRGRLRADDQPRYRAAEYRGRAGVRAWRRRWAHRRATRAAGRRAWGWAGSICRGWPTCPISPSS